MALILRLLILLGLVLYGSCADAQLVPQDALIILMGGTSSASGGGSTPCGALQTDLSDATGCNMTSFLVNMR